MGTSKEGGGGAARQLSTQFSVQKILIEVTDWKGDMLIVRADDKHGLWATQHVRISQESGSLQGVVPNDAGTSNRSRQVTIQEHIEERQRDEEFLTKQQETLPSSEAPTSSKSSKARISEKKAKSRNLAPTGPKSLRRK